MIQRTNTNLVQRWIAVTDAAGRSRLESRWFEVTRPVAPTYGVSAA